MSFETIGAMLGIVIGLSLLAGIAARVLPSFMRPLPAPPVPALADIKSETNSIGMTMLFIPAGEFTMGSRDGGDVEKPPHKVRIAKPFWLGKCEVTVGQFRKFVEESEYAVDNGWQTAFASQTDDHPVVNVSWYAANAFCDWLTKNESRQYRLPTEAEWEYACRAGTQTKWSFGDNESDLGTYVWFSGNSYSQTHPVGKKRPNAWGLHDMHGNVWELCADWYDSRYRSSSLYDPKGPASGTFRVARGGSWRDAAVDSRSTFRMGAFPNDNYYFIGFRVARTS